MPPNSPAHHLGMTLEQPRQPKGVPSGGQFATGTRSETTDIQLSPVLAQIDLDTDQDQARRPSISNMLDAYAQWDGEVDTFILAWENYLAGTDTPCPNEPSGVHSTYLVDDGSCNYCGEKNR